MKNESKITGIDELAIITGRLRDEGRRIVHCHGVFDLLHIGHIRYLQQAKTLGDVLVVTVTPDEFVDKGPHRPAFTETYRVEAVASLDVVDYAAVNRWPTAEETLRLLRPHVYVKGADFRNAEADRTGKLAREQAVAREIGAELVFTKDVVFSSTNLINRFLSSFPEEIQQYLSVFRARHGIEEIVSLLDRMSELRVLVVGDTILDDYHYCHAVGTSSKDPVLALKYDSSDLFAGGVLAVANHIANFARSVKLVSVIGEKDSYEEFILSKLRENVTPRFFVQDDAPTIIKRRFVEGYSLNKLLEIYIMDDGGLAPARDAECCEWLGERRGSTISSSSPISATGR
ncbi:MAG: adenylyltransferase/cytidyltransferase family protein [Candidatus Latescibacteria bacterium]|nr:adenylyltransferase/cytidyltransferase family protein [Candidatus Latescibacterota bacterium]